MTEPLDDSRGGVGARRACASTASAIAGSTSSAVPRRGELDVRDAVGERSCTAAATASASRVFPTPPIPVNVTNRCSPSPAVTRAMSASRPSRAVAGAAMTADRDGVAGRLPRPGARRHRRDQRGPGIGVGAERVAQRPHVCG